MIVYITLGVIVASLFIYYRYQQNLVEQKQERRAATMQPPRRVYQSPRTNFNSGLKGEQLVLVSQSGSDNVKSFKFESPRKIAGNTPGLGVISPFKDSSFSPINVQDNLFRPKKSAEFSKPERKSVFNPSVPVIQTQQHHAVKEFKSPLPRVQVETPVKVHVDTPRPMEVKSYAPVTPSPLVRVTNKDELELDSGEIADISSEVKPERKKSSATPIRKKKTAGRTTKKTPGSVRKGVTSVRSRVGLFESLGDANQNQNEIKVKTTDKQAEKPTESRVEKSNKSKRKFEEDEFPENLLPEDGFSWQLGDNVRLKKKVKTKQEEETIVKKRIEFFKNLGFDITKSTELSQDQAPVRLPISSTEDGTKKRLRKELDEDELDEITINRLKKESPAKKDEFAVPEITVKKVYFAAPENKDGQKEIVVAAKTSEENPALFTAPVAKKDTTDAKPDQLFTFGQDTPSKVENKKVEKTPLFTLPKTEKTDITAPPAFSFGKPTENTSVPPLADVKNDSLKTFTFGKPEEKKDSGESTLKPSIPTFTFGKPAETKGSDKPDAPTFTFGKPADTTAAPAFSFGKPVETKEAPSAITPSFSFGKPAEEKKDAPSVPMFSFGKPAENKPETAAPSTAPTFSFGKPGEKTETGTSNTSAPTFSLGKPTETTPAPSFSFGNPAEQKDKAPTFTFGKPADTKPAEGTGSTNTTVPSFGQNTLSTTPSFGQTNASNTANPPATFSFGQPPAPNSAPTFGKPAETTTSTPSFGQPAAPTFGQSNTTAPSFGQGNTSFGQNAPSFGQSNTSFGQNSNTTTFGANTAKPPAFGQTATTPAPAPAFGQANAPANAFGQTSTTPSFGGNNAFGQTNTNTSGNTNTFGQTNTFGTSNSTFGGANTTFGSNSAQPQPNTFGTQPAAGFGAPSQPGQTGFGQNNNFGQPGNTTNPAPAFGNNPAPTFGQSTATFGQPTTNPPTFGQSNQSAGFNFQAPTGAPSFNFGASAPQSFQFGAGNSQPSQNLPPNMNRPMATPKFRRGPKGGRR
ncbi:hypothetical protein HDV01_000815 [Terramyces sp. JEL0728]|nr:hypothetical protein HDV01_000815 [Terramyces sp. JEL0728]